MLGERYGVLEGDGLGLVVEGIRIVTFATTTIRVDKIESSIALSRDPWRESGMEVSDERRRFGEMV